MGVRRSTRGQMDRPERLTYPCTTHGVAMTHTTISLVAFTFYQVFLDPEMVEILKQAEDETMSAD